LVPILLQSRFALGFQILRAVGPDTNIVPTTHVPMNADIVTPKISFAAERGVALGLLTLAIINSTLTENDGRGPAADGFARG
jgi:hypothetical protein